MQPESDSDLASIQNVRHTRGRNTYCACLCFSRDIDALIHGKPSVDRQSVPAQIYFCQFKMTSQGPALTSIPQVHSGLAGHYICEVIHETGVLVALDLMARLLLSLFCVGREGSMGCQGATIACDVLVDCSRQPGGAAFYWWLAIHYIVSINNYVISCSMCLY
jgi:hypothetical protein